MYCSEPGKHNYTVVQFSILYSINNPVSLYYRNPHKLEQFTEVSQTIHTFCHPIIISRTSLGFVAWVNCSLLRTFTHCFRHCTHSFRHEQEPHMVLCIQTVITFFLLVPLPRIVASYSTFEHPTINFVLTYLNHRRVTEHRLSVYHKYITYYKWRTHVTIEMGKTYAVLIQIYISEKVVFQYFI